jgi:hypothetical protein
MATSLVCGGEPQYATDNLGRNVVRCVRKHCGPALFDRAPMALRR